MSDSRKGDPILSEKKHALLKSLRQKRHLEVPRISSIGRRRQDSPLPQSFAQQRLWFLDQLDPGSPSYNIVTTARLKGALAIGALECSLREIVRRHEVLRTTFGLVDGQPVQLVKGVPTLILREVDLGEVPVGVRDTEVRRLVHGETGRRFDLAQGPLLCAMVVRLGAEENVLILSVHHIVSDGWSMVGVFFRELAVLYDGFVAGRPAVLPELAVQYGDYAVWQREWLQGEQLDRELSYWKEQLAGSPPLVELPADYPRPAAQSYRGGRRSLEVSDSLTASLKGFCQREGVTLFMALLAAFQVLLHRWSGEDDIVVGTTAAGRSRAEVEGLIGFFVNTLVLRTWTGGEPSFRELLGRVREVCLGAYSHQEMPFEKLVEELRPGRDLSRTPLFQVLFNMHNIPGVRLRLSGLSVEYLYPPETLSKFDLALDVWERDNRLRLDLIYREDLFSAERVVLMLEQLEGLLREVVEDAERRIGEYTLVTAGAREILPDPAVELGDEWRGSIQALFSEQAARVGERLAAVDPRERWSYGELEARSNQLAHYLRGAGIGKGDVVAIYGHRSVWFVCGLLGILKAGGAFLILDPAYPAARLRAYMELARPRGWLGVETAGGVSEELAGYVRGGGFKVRMVLPGEGSWAECSAAGCGVEVGGEDMAYVVFTSGSTGEPKGIVGRHGPVTHFLPWMRERFELGEEDRFSMLSGLSFNPLQREIFMPLYLGATVCIPDGQEIAPERLARWMEGARITVAHLTPAMGRILCEGWKGVRLGALRWAIYAGDALKKRDVEMLRQLAPGAGVANFYGASETQRAVGHYVIRVGEEVERETVPLGRGIEGVQLLVLNGAGGLAGVGELGEIYFRSPHLARGYLGDEELTRERFLSNGFTGRSGDRLYRTFELGRYLPRGDVELVGRRDAQVNIRGFRVDLGEVEGVLRRHGRIRDAVVLAREEGDGDKRLVGYVVPEGSGGLTVTELRQFLLRILPEHMVPSWYVFMDSLPLTPNGKVDRGGLPAPEGGRPELGDAFVAPRGAVEEVMAAIWSELLGVERVGVRDNFFDLGGHSLLAARVIHRVRDALQVELPLRSLFEAPTIAGMTQLVCREPEAEQRVRRTAELLLQLARLSDTEVDAMLEDRGSSKDKN